jgi:hypothetical protein
MVAPALRNPWALQLQRPAWLHHSRNLLPKPASPPFRPFEDRARSETADLSNGILWQFIVKPSGERERGYGRYVTHGEGDQGSNPMGAHAYNTGTFTNGTFRFAQERSFREIQTSIARALKATYEPPQFVPEPLASLLAQLVRGEGRDD